MSEIELLESILEVLENIRGTLKIIVCIGGFICGSLTFGKTKG